MNITYTQNGDYLLPAFIIYEGDEQKDRQDLLSRY